MKKTAILALTLSASLTIAGTVVAQTKHHGGHGGDQSAEASSPKPESCEGDRRGMMEGMKHRHGAMMGGGMDHHHAHGMMMDRMILRLMTGAGMMSSASDDDAAKTLRSRLEEYDADGDGNLALAEFEALHAAMVREKTVDKFQHLDADGNGKVTPDEMAAPASRLKAHRMHGDDSNEDE